MATRIPQNAPSFVQLQGFLGSFLLNCNSRPWRPGILNCSWWKLWLFNHLFLWLVMAGGSFFLFFSFEVEHRCFIPTKGCSVSTMITISDWSPSLASSASGEKIASEDLGHHGGASFHARQMSRCLWYSYLELVWILNFGTCLICLVLKQALTKLSRNYPWTVLKPWLEPSVEDQSSWLTALGLVVQDSISSACLETGVGMDFDPWAVDPWGYLLLYCGITLRGNTPIYETLL